MVQRFWVQRFKVCSPLARSKVIARMSKISQVLRTGVTGWPATVNPEPRNLINRRTKNHLADLLGFAL